MSDTHPTRRRSPLPCSSGVDGRRAALEGWRARRRGHLPGRAVSWRGASVSPGRRSRRAPTPRRTDTMRPGGHEIVGRPDRRRRVSGRQTAAPGPHRWSWSVGTTNRIGDLVWADRALLMRRRPGCRDQRARGRGAAGRRPAPATARAPAAWQCMPSLRASLIPAAKRPRERENRPPVGAIPERNQQAPLVRPPFPLGAVLLGLPRQPCRASRRLTWKTRSYVPPDTLDGTRRRPLHFR